jgi:omega-amidase
VNIHGCQFDIAWENKVENFERVRQLVARHKISPGSLLVLPEMFATGFSMNAESIAEPVNGLTQRFLRGLAREKQIYVLGGLACRERGAKIFNEAVCIAPSGRSIARYAKLHTFAPGGEAQHYASGKKMTLFQWNGLTVAVFICYDLRFPEIFRLAAQRGAEAFVVIANWPRKRHAHWLALLRARAIENQAYVVGVNRCGRDPKLDYAGGSIVIDPRGNNIASAGRRESLLSALLDSSAPSRWRGEFSALKDIRTVFRLQSR